MNQEIINYFEENKGQRTKEKLIEELKQKGFKQSEIDKGVKKVYLCSNPLDGDFWDFRSKKIYCSESEKMKDFALGALAPIPAAILYIVPVLGPLVYIGFYFYYMFYLFNKRRWISIGIIINFFTTIAVVAYIILFVISDLASLESILQKFIP
jgi:hypothetical protein